MDILDLIRTRRSIRSFEDRPVEASLVDLILEAGRWAPSACNIQGSRYIVIKDQKRKEELIRAGVNKLRDTPLGIFVLYDNRTNNPEYMDHIQSGAACVQNMLLCAHALGLGGVWTCDLPPQKKMRKLLGIPWHYSIIALVRLGYPKFIPQPVKRKYSLGSMYSWDYYEGSEEESFRDRRWYWLLRYSSNKIYNISLVRSVVLGVSHLFPRGVRDRVKGFLSRKFE